MIRLQNLALRRGTKVLFENCDLTINPGEKVGLVGSNGAGKSSLFALLRQELHTDAGSIDFPSKWQVAHVAQETPALDRSALDYAIDGDARLRALEARLAELENQPHDDAQGIALGEIHSALADADAYTVKARAEQLLLGLGFSMEQISRPVASFSGGWRMRLNLAQALMCPSDLLLLDEPTNHLDLDAIIWLEDWLKRYPGTLVIISHDRDFLDGVTNVIVHIDDKRLKRYSGNYSAFERQRAAQLELAAGMIEKQNRQRAHLQSFIDRFKAKATKAKQAQSRIKALARMEELAPLRAAAEFSFEFREPLSAPNPMLVLDEVECGYQLEDGSQKKILNKIEFSLQIGQRIGLLGVNGAGKSTLIKTLVGDIAPLTGKIQRGKGLVIGYFAQHQLEMLRHDESPLWHLQKLAPDVREQELRNFLGSFNFPGEMVTSPIAPFSGGEKARLALAMIVWQRPNLLLLDEPTNHLDLETREALTEALAQFEGTLVVVSHDRHLLRATTDSFLIVAEQQLRPFDGDLDDYRDWMLTQRQQDKLAASSANSAKAEGADKTAAGDKLDDKERRRREAEDRQRLSALRKPIERRIQQLEKQMAQLQAEKQVHDEALADSDIYAEANKDKLKHTVLEQTRLAKALEQVEMDWLEQQEALEALN